MRQCAASLCCPSVWTRRRSGNYRQPPCVCFWREKKHNLLSATPARSAMAHALTPNAVRVSAVGRGGTVGGGAADTHRTARTRSSAVPPHAAQTVAPLSMLPICARSAGWRACGACGAPATRGGGLDVERLCAHALHTPPDAARSRAASRRCRWKRLLFAPFCSPTPPALPAPAPDPLALPPTRAHRRTSTRTSRPWTPSCRFWSAAQAMPALSPCFLYGSQLTLEHPPPVSPSLLLPLSPTAATQEDCRPAGTHPHPPPEPAHPTPTATHPHPKPSSLSPQRPKRASRTATACPSRMG